MSSPNKDTTAKERRKSERRLPAADERRAEVERSVIGDRRVVEQRGVAEAMVDALEDILRYERTTERAIKIEAVVHAVTRARGRNITTN